jgi:hypothetical protein
VKQSARFVLCSATVLLLLACWIVFSSFREGGSAAAVRRVLQNDQQPVPPRKENMADSYLIEPGMGIGKYRLGDTRERALNLVELDPVFESGEEIQTDECGTEYEALDAKSHPHGNFDIRYANSMVSQIESGTPRYHTALGTKAYDSPDMVQRLYKGLRAYAVSGNSPMAFGGGSLIYWIDWSKGLAFFFASTRATRQRYLYSIIVFKPGGKFCPERGSTKSPNWLELAPYSLEVPKDKAQNDHHSLDLVSRVAATKATQTTEWC